jgi:hypothetical protein
MTERRLDLRAAALLLLVVLAAGAGCSMRRPATSATRTVESADEAVDMCAAFACEP